MIKAAFLDRDGVVNVDKGYVYKIDDFQFIEGIFDLCRLFQDRQYKIVIISNQSGIARGYYTIDQLKELTGWMRNRFEDQDVFISKFYFCPHHPVDGIGKFKKECNCRKPNPGMILRAQKEMQLNLGKSLLVGNQLSDIDAGKNAGVIRKYLIGPKNKFKSDPANCDVFENLIALTDFLAGVRK